MIAPVARATVQRAHLVPAPRDPLDGDRRPGGARRSPSRSAAADDRSRAASSDVRLGVRTVPPTPEAAPLVHRDDGEAAPGEPGVDAEHGGIEHLFARV